MLKSPAGERFKELGGQNLSQVVDRNRTESTDFPFIEIFENKYIENLKIRTKASLGVFSPNFLFLAAFRVTWRRKHRVPFMKVANSVTLCRMRTAPHSIIPT